MQQQPTAQSAQTEREKYILAWNDTMINIWKEQIFPASCETRTQRKTVICPLLPRQANYFEHTKQFLLKSS